MKSRFEKLAGLATVAATRAKYPGANESFNKATDSAVAAGKFTREALDTAVGKTGEILREVSVHDFTKAATTKVRSVVTDSAAGLQKLAARGVEPSKGAAGDFPSGDSTDDIEVAIEKLNSPDKVGRAGEVLGGVGGAVAGASAAGVVAAAAGVTTIFGSTTVGAVLGGTFVAATPVGWIIGTATVAGAAGYGIAKMIRSGSKQDHIRSEIIERLNQRLASIQAKSGDQAVVDALRKAMSVALEAGLVTQDQARRMIDLVEKGSLSASIALARIQGIIEQKSVPSRASRCCSIQ